MNDRTKVSKVASEKSANAEPERLECGVIMPISETANHSEDHWRKVQKLLHRTIDAAGFTPRNVWESTTSDRISERIIGSLFEVPIAIADISDLNPNVMLELGLRLASKKPTVVIANVGGEIPFDISDFHATFYPADLNILDMEEFFRDIEKVLKEKLAAVQDKAYVPFLGRVIVDVASPETREVGLNELLLSRLDQIGSRLSNVEADLKRSRPSGIAAAARGERPTRSFASSFRVKIPEQRVKAFISEAVDSFEISSIREGSTELGLTSLDLQFSGVPYGISSKRIRELGSKYDVIIESITQG